MSNPREGKRPDELAIEYIDHATLVPDPRNARKGGSSRLATPLPRIWFDSGSRLVRAVNPIRLGA